MTVQKKSSVNKKAPAQVKAMFTSRIRPVGNSKGVLLNNSIIKAAGIDMDADITIEATAGVITIVQAKPEVNTDLQTWDAQFKKAIKAGAKPEKDLFEGLVNEFDKKEW